jgi:hypothetical protein
MRGISLRIDRHLLLLLLLSLFALSPLLAPGYFYAAHDGRHSVFFVTMFDEAIGDGALWPRWAMHHSQGYGYPTFIGQAPLAFYVAEFFILLGLGVTDAVKCAWAAGVLAGAWGMYALVRTWILETEERRAGQRVAPSPVSYWASHASLAGLVAGLLYTYAPYHLLDLYVRAAFAETLLMAWFPWVFLAFEQLIARGSAPGWQSRLLAAALCYAGMLLTHAIALLAVTPLLIVFVLFRLWTVGRCTGNLPEMQDETGAPPPDTSRQVQPGASGHWIKRIALVASAGMAGLLLAMVFIMPLLAEGPLVVQEDFTRETYHYERHWVYWGQWFSPLWGYGYSDDPDGANDRMGFQIGVMLVLLALLAGMLLMQTALDNAEEAERMLTATGRRRSASPWDEQRRLLLFWLLAAAVTLFVMTPAAAWFWRRAPILGVIQFPWRMLALSVFCLSAAGGLVVWLSSRKLPARQAEVEDSAGILVIGLLVALAGYVYSHPQSMQPIEPWRDDGRAIFQFEQEHPDMLGYTRLVEERFTESPMTAQYQAEDFSNDLLERLAILSGEGKVLRHYSRGHSFGGEVEMASPGTVQVRVYDFPGWQVRLDGERVEHRLSPPYALMELDVPAGRHRIDVRMGMTPPRVVGAAISGVILLILLGLWAYGRVSAQFKSKRGI